MVDVVLPVPLNLVYRLVSDQSNLYVLTNLLNNMTDSPTGDQSEVEFPDPDPPTLIEDGRLIVADGWEETKFEQAEYGPDQQRGVSARFESGSDTIEVIPIEFERMGNTETFEALTADMGVRQSSPEIDDKPNVGPRTAFAVHLKYDTFSSWDSEYYTITNDGEDALAVACWLTNSAVAGGTGEMCDIVDIHNGETPDYDPRPDEDRLEGVFDNDPGRCLISGSPTQSHEVTIPFRYAPLLEGYPTTYQDVPAIPETVDSFRAAVSHTAWSENDLTENAFRSRVERSTSGEYELDENVIETVEGFSVEDVALSRLE